MPLLDFFSNPNVAVAAGLLSPTRDKNFGQGLLQGITAGQGSRQNNTQDQLGQIANQMRESSEQRRQAQQGIVSGMQGGNQFQQGLIDAAAQSNNPAQTLISAVQSSAFDAPQGSGFKGTGVGQFYNTYIDLLGKKQAGETLSPKENLQFEAASRELLSPKIVGTPETGYTAVPAQPLPGLPQAAQGAQGGQAGPGGGQGGEGAFTDPTRLLSKSEREGLRNPTTGELPPIGTTLGEATEEGSPFVSMNGKDSERLFAGKSALGIVDSLEEMSGGLFKPFDGITQRAIVSGTNFKDYMGGQNTSLSTYVDARKGTLSMIVRALGEKGVLTQQDIQRIQSFIPSVFPIPDTPDAANNKFNQLRGIIEEINGRFETSNTGAINRKDPTRQDLLDFYSR